jgi:hypothetical protein
METKQMTLTTRTATTLTLFLALASSAIAQAPAATPTHATTSAAQSTTATDATPAPDAEVAVAPMEGRSSQETRSEFLNILRQHPPELGTILSLDPTLLSNDAFLQGYPELSKFVIAHPEVRRNPRFFLDDFERPQRRDNDILEGLFILTIMSLIAFTMSWLVRTIVEQRRWSRLSRTQTEVHTKILDRFGTSGELLEYMKTPAGSKFLESAPIPLREQPMAANAPVARVLWSIQLGIIVAAGAMGMMLVSSRFEDAAKSFFALGLIGVCVGGGFILSAIVSLVVSRRLGLWQSPTVVELGEAEPGSVQ